MQDMLQLLIGEQPSTKNGVKLQTIEHILAACAGLKIDNLLIELNGEEPPIFGWKLHRIHPMFEKSYPSSTKCHQEVFCH